MIQRIQTLWMLATTALVVFAVLAALGLVGAGSPELWLAVALGLAAAVPLVTIFLYKNRQRQLSLLAGEMVLLLGCAGFAVYYAWIADTAWAYSPVMVFIALITNYLAVRGVMRDQILIKGADRIR